MNIVNNYTSFYLEKITEKFFLKIKHGKVLVTYPSNQILSYSGSDKGITADIKLKNFKLFYKLFTKGSVGFAESYMDGDFETSNLSNLLFLAHQNESVFLKDKRSKLFLKYFIKLKHYLNENTKKNSVKNISYHYDLGNKFYKHWLDETMTYSSGIFDETTENLDSAQIKKFEKIIEPMQLDYNSSLLEIGCGWGGFSTFLAKNLHIKVKAITISKEQFEYTKEKIFHEGLNEKISIEMRDYRDIDEKFTNIASIEMFEAVGKKYWEKYFDVVKNSLSNSGKAALQIITIDENRSYKYQHQPDFIQQYIFPGGMLPSKKELNEINQKLGLDFKEIKSFGLSYAKTLNLWNKQFQDSWQDLVKLGFNDRFKRMWEFYLAYCETGFISKSTDVSHFLINK
mgnify:CR=1 FL=1